MSDDEGVCENPRVAKKAKMAVKNKIPDNVLMFFSFKRFNNVFMIIRQLFRKKLAVKMGIGLFVCFFFTG